MSSTSERPHSILEDMTAEDVRAYLLTHTDFFEENEDLFEALVPPSARADGEGVRDFQHYMLAKLQNDYVVLRVEHDDLMDLMQEHLQRQGRINNAIAALLDAPDFNSTLSLIANEFASILEHEGVGFFLEAGGWLDQGDYNGLKVVPPGYVGRWLSGRAILLEEVEGGASPDLYGENAKAIHSQALVRLVIREGLPPGLLALGHSDPMHYATGLATEQIESLGCVVERCLRKWLT